jgi:hypothetical protein
VRSAKSGEFCAGLKPCSTIATRMFGLARWIARPILPVGPSGSPFVSFCHVRPASVDLKMPPFGPPLRNLFGYRRRSQNVTYSTFGFLGSIRSSLAPVRASSGRPFVSLVHVVPPSLVLNRPRSPVWPHRCPCEAT